MKISKFFENVKNANCPKLQEGSCITLQNFFDKCVAPNLPKVKTVKAWNDLLKKYVSDPSAIFFIRRYASGRDKDSGWEIRRGFLTETENNVRYVFVDNFFAQYFFAMAINDFVPTYDEFVSFITTRKIPYGYMVVSKELKHQAFVKGPIYPLNTNGWKLSHVYSANQKDYSFDYKKEVKKLFPKGEYTDFKKQDGRDYPFRKLDVALSGSDIQKVKAHFLRVVHPLNHFLTPMTKYQLSKQKIKDIGENREMIAYMQSFLKKRYGKVFEDYQKMIMAAEPSVNGETVGNKVVDITYGFSVKELKKKQTEVPSVESTVLTAKASTKATKKTQKLPSASKFIKVDFTPNAVANCIRAYLFEGFSFRDLEDEMLDIEYKTRGGGFVAQTLMRNLGIPASNKGMYKGKTFEQALKEADDSYKDILNFMVKHL